MRLTPSEAEHQRLDDMHHFWNLLLGDLILPKLDCPPKQILDIGCGTGIYCLELADQYAFAEIHGVDISPIQPKYLPGNCTFYVADVMEGLWFQDEKFDFIHSRDIHSGIPGNRWDEYLSEIFRLLKPGGWLQLIEMDPWPSCDDGTLSQDSAWITYLLAMKEMLDQSGVKVFGLGRELARLVEEAGFMNITEITLKVPLGKWTKGNVVRQGRGLMRVDKMQRRLGEIIKKVWRAAADSALPLLKMCLGDEAEAIRICEQTKAEQADGSIHAYFNMYFSTQGRY